MADFLFIYSIVALGVFISFILPVLKLYAIKPPGEKLSEEKSSFARFRQVAGPYVVTAIFSLVLGLLIVAATQETLTDWRAALLAGYAGDSTIQKFRN